jgi:hypothetical protein
MDPGPKSIDPVEPNPFLIQIRTMLFGLLFVTNSNFIISFQGIRGAVLGAGTTPSWPSLLDSRPTEAA